MCIVWCMTRTNIDIDDALIAEVMRRYHKPTKKSAVEFALKQALLEDGLEKMSLVEIVESLAGIGWDGDLDEIRSGDRVEEFEIGSADPGEGPPKGPAAQPAVAKSA